MARGRRGRGRPVNGIVVVDKAQGLSSNDMLQRIKRLFGAAKAGHTGSLDPLATGVLPICFGEATKFSQFLLESDKAYRATVKMGVKTSTGDAEGEVIETRPVQVTKTDVEAVLSRFVGELEQVPSMYSALKYKGQPLYKLAREGIEVERQARKIHIYHLSLLSFSEDSFDIDVACSKGTYIRTLVEDIGETLGCLAHVEALRRVKAGPYGIDQSYTLDELFALRNEGRHKALTQEQAEELEALMARVDEVGRDSLDADELELMMALLRTRNQGGLALLDALLQPQDSAVSHWPEVRLGESSAFFVSQGQPVQVPGAPVSGHVRIYGHCNDSSGGGFMGVGEINEDGLVAPKRLVKIKH
ncbi:tRNA pseudouridine synthase B [invertebrate metagenome]|uniref:tRNA pseudouridine(55) synthase n=1 Tax=invertebrate metagenome TaxID=1711999 RepID=A0A2H9T8X9_9ZZZZ